VQREEKRDTKGAVIIDRLTIAPIPSPSESPRSQREDLQEWRTKSAILERYIRDLCARISSKQREATSRYDRTKES